jgi:hypothetical protein
MTQSMLTSPASYYKAREDTREETAQEQALILAERIALLRKEGRKAAKPESA